MACFTRVKVSKHKSVHREHGKHDNDSETRKSRKQQPVILSVIISVDIGVLADIRYLILKPICADDDEEPIISCIPSYQHLNIKPNFFHNCLIKENLFYFLYSVNSSEQHSLIVSPHEAAPLQASKVSCEQC